jgi:outer membrane protein TolC
MPHLVLAPPHSSLPRAASIVGPILGAPSRSPHLGSSVRSRSPRLASTLTSFVAPRLASFGAPRLASFGAPRLASFGAPRLASIFASIFASFVAPRLASTFASFVAPRLASFVAPRLASFGAPRLASIFASFVAPVLALSLAGCVASPQAVRAPVDRLVSERLDAQLGPQTAAQIDALLAQPLDTRAAVRIALANSPRLRAAYAELDLAAADVAAALGLGPLEIEAQLRFGSAHNELEIDAIQGLVGLLTAPSRRAAANAELGAARAGAAAAALRLAARVEIALADLLAAQQVAELRRTAFDAADAAAAVRERMYTAGNTTELARARDRDAREQTRVDLGRAQAAVEVSRETVNALLGLSGARTTWTAAGTLRDVPAEPPELDAIEATAVAASLELSAGRARREAAGHRVSGERLRTVLPDLGAGITIANDGHETEIGPAVRIGIPLLDFRSGERARANAQLRREDHALAADAIELRAAARAARVTALAAYREARHLHDVVLPLRQQIVEETLKHYNAMDADPFSLIIARRELVDGADQYVDALRRYWNAMAEVTALGRGVALEPTPGPRGVTREPTSRPTEDH